MKFRNLFAIDENLQDKVRTCYTKSPNCMFYFLIPTQSGEDIKPAKSGDFAEQSSPLTIDQKKAKPYGASQGFNEYVSQLVI